MAKKQQSKQVVKAQPEQIIPNAEEEAPVKSTTINNDKKESKNNQNELSSEQQVNANSSSSSGLSIIGKLLQKEAPAASKQEQVPVLAFQKSFEAKLENEKLEKKVRCQMRAEKRQLMELGHVPVPQATTFNREKKLRKIATKGVVQLFNAIKQQQKDAENSGRPSAQVGNTLDAGSKSKFMDMIKSNTSKMASQMNHDEDEESDF